MILGENGNVRWNEKKPRYTLRLDLLIGYRSRAFACVGKRPVSGKHTG